MIYILSDIHGNRRRFDSVMRQIDLQPDDRLYVLGDVIDRYPDGIEILRELMRMPNVEMLLGNHEYMMLQYLDPLFDEAEPSESDAQSLWYYNGGRVTHHALKQLSDDERAEIFEYLRSRPIQIDLLLGGEKYTLVHGAPKELYPEFRLFYPSEKQFCVWKRIKKYDPRLTDRTVIFGHTPTVSFQRHYPTQIWHSDHLIGIDCGAGFPEDPEECKPYYGRLGCLRLDDMKEYYSEETFPKRWSSRKDGTDPDDYSEQFKLLR